MYNQILYIIYGIFKCPLSISIFFLQDLLMNAVEAIGSDEIIFVNQQPGQADLIDENFIIIDHQPGVSISIMICLIK